MAIAPSWRMVKNVAGMYKTALPCTYHILHYPNDCLSFYTDGGAYTIYGPLELSGEPLTSIFSPSRTFAIEAETVKKEEAARALVMLRSGVIVEEEEKSGDAVEGMARMRS